MSQTKSKKILQQSEVAFQSHTQETESFMSKMMSAMFKQQNQIMALINSVDWWGGGVENQP